MPASLAFRNSCHGSVECARSPAELVVVVLQAVQTDSGVGKADLLKPLGRLLIDLRPVGGQDDAHAPFPGELSQFEQVFPHERFAAGKKQHRAPERGQILDQTHALIGRKFVFAPFVRRLGITVHAVKVAPFRDVPNDDGLFILGKLQQMGRKRL